METKRCSTCQTTKLLADFYLKNGRPSSSSCKECFKAKMAARRDSIRPILRQKQREYVRRNKDAVAASTKKWVEKNKDKMREYQREYYRKNHKRVRVRKNMYQRQRVKSDPAFRLRSLIARRLLQSMRASRNTKNCSTIEAVGCDMKFLKDWIEKQFVTGMTWQNQGMHGWHIDHIIPCASFDHSDPKQVKQCWHFTNLRPMWAKDNLAKSDKLIMPQLSLLL